MRSDELAERLLATFVEELDEQTARLNDELLALEGTPDDSDRLRGVFRIAHTLKGAARAAGVSLIEDLCHALESLLAEARDGRLRLGAEQFALLFATADALAEAGARLRQGDQPDEEIMALARRLISVRGGSREPGAHHPPVPEAESAPVRARATPPEGTDAGRTSRDDGRHLRVQPEKLDALLASAGQLLISAGRGERHAELARNAAELSQRLQMEWRRSWRRVRGALERTEVQVRDLDALERIGERVDHLTAELTRLEQGAQRDGARLWRVSGDVAERVRALRMRPFADAVEALPRLVRDVSKRTGKEVELIIEGGEIEADRAVLEGLRDALVHLIRNAVDHGIEHPDHRARSGKPRRGTIRVRAALQGDGLVVTIADDGHGLNADAVRKQLERRGLAVPSTDREMAALLFEGGLSTREQATEISGRGVGLDVVRSSVQRIRGTVDVRWRAGGGTTFTIEAPLTLATLRVLLVRVGGNLFGLPTGAVERLLHVRAGDVRRVEGRQTIAVEGEAVPLAALASLLGPPVASDEPPGEVFCVALVRGVAGRLAVKVDEMISEQEIMLRPLERIGAPRVETLAGATLLPSGRVALVVNVGSLLRGARRAATAPAATHELAAPERRRRVLVVDDSITTRVIEQTVLESAGYDVSAAVDGTEAWNLLQERGADVVVTDIEMPRMDGFQLCEAMRASRRFRETPVVLVTSLESAEHRQRGLEAGADAYIVKSSFDQETLLETLAQLLR